MSDEPTEFWFPVSDLLPLVEHRPATVPGRQAPCPPRRLLLMYQGPLRYLITDAAPPLLTDARDPDSVQRVYAVGHSYYSGEHSFAPNPERYGTPILVTSVDLHTGTREMLITALQHGVARGHDWLALTLSDGRVSWRVRSLPRPDPAVQWRAAPLQVYGLAGTFPGEFTVNTTNRGWIIVRFTRTVAAHIAEVLRDTPRPSPQISAVRIVDTPDDPDDPWTVGVDTDGYWRVGEGWLWVSPALAPPGRIVPFTGPIPPGIEPGELPALGQDVYWALGCLMWLDAHGDLLALHTVDGFIDPDDSSDAPQYGTIAAEYEWQFRAAEHQLRLIRDLAPTASRTHPTPVGRPSLGGAS